MKTQLTREKALELLKTYNQEPFHILHALTVEGTMRWYAKELGYGGEEDFWGIVGLLHDIDFEQYPEEHCLKAPELLKAGGAEDELIHAMNHFELRGGGGTDFRPAFEYVNQLCAEKKFSNLRGLLYFTDGMGTYPAKRPAYDTAFLFLGERFDDANVPPWAMKVVLDEEEFTGAAARPQSTLADALAEEDDLYRDLNNS